MFIFGADVEQVDQFREKMRNGNRDYVGSRLKRVLDAIKLGRFGDLSMMHGMLNNLTNGNDFYVLCWDFYDYIRAQEEVDKAYKDQTKWNAMSIHNVAFSGKFSSDRTIQEYCRDIW
jgi:starch phosphorylase